MFPIISFDTHQLASAVWPPQHLVPWLWKQPSGHHSPCTLSLVVPQPQEWARKSGLTSRCVSLTFLATRSKDRQVTQAKPTRLSSRTFVRTWGKAEVLFLLSCWQLWHGHSLSLFSTVWAPGSSHAQRANFLRFHGVNTLFCWEAVQPRTGTPL